MALFSSYQDLLDELNRDDIEVRYVPFEDQEGGAALTRSQAKRQKISDPALDVSKKNEGVLPSEFESLDESAELPQERDPEPHDRGDEPPGRDEPGGDEPGDEPGEDEPGRHEPGGQETDQGQYYKALNRTRIIVLIKVLAVTN